MNIQLIKRLFKKPIVLFTGLFVLQTLIYNYFDYMQMEPRSIHSWRQTDCLSFAQSFYHDRATFAEPCVNNLGKTDDGKIASDFPIIQYLIGKTWKVTGMQPIIYRFVNLMFLFLGLWYVFKLFRYWLDENIRISLFLTGIIFTSPILSYYGPTFISDIQALGLSMAGIYYFVRWLDSFQRKQLLFAVLFFTFAGLFKMSSAFIYMICWSFLLIRILFIWKQNLQWNLINVKNIALLLLPFIPWYFWYSFAGHYNQLHDNGFFLIGILPIWEADVFKMKEIFMSLIHYIFPQMISSILLIGSLFSFAILSIVNYKKLFSEYMLRIFAILAVFGAYIVLFFQVFDVHDYYMINLMPVVILILGILTKHLHETHYELFSQRYFTVGLILFLVILTHNAAVRTRARIDMNDTFGVKSLVFNKQENDYYVWNTWFDRTRFEVLEIMNPSEIGISESDTILVLGDHSINRSLYLLDRVGYTSFNVHLEDIGPFIEAKKKIGLKYLILIEPDWKESEYLLPYKSDLIFEDGGTQVFRIN